MVSRNTAPIFNIQHFSLHDGPGIRTSVFFKGCNLRCYWCHNPESHSAKAELRFFAGKCIGCGKCVRVCRNAWDGHSARFTDRCTMCGECAQECYSGALELTGETMTMDQVMADIARDKNVYATSNGGVTCTGGEPLLYPAFVEELLRKCRDEGIHTGIETALHVPQETMLRVLPYTDLLMTDVKTMDEQAHIRGTGVSNTTILENIRRAAASDVPLLIRTPVVPGFNATEQDISAIADFIRSLPRREKIRWELLPFRGYCAAKYASLRRDFAAADVESPSEETMRRFAQIAVEKGISCRAVL